VDARHGRDGPGRGTPGPPAVVASWVTVAENAYATSPSVGIDSRAACAWDGGHVSNSVIRRSTRALQPGTTRRLWLLGRVVVAGMLLGSTYGTLLNFAAYGELQFGVPIGAIHGFLLSSTIGWLEIFGTRTRPGRAVEQAPFLVTLLVKGLLYGSMIAFVNIVEPGTRPALQARVRQSALAAFVEPDGRGHRYGAPRQGLVFPQWAHRNDALFSIGTPGAA
jgi:hypothetical protein